MAKVELDYIKLPTEVDVAYKPIGGKVGIDADRKAEIVSTTAGNADIKKAADAIDAALGTAPQAATYSGNLTVTDNDTISHLNVTINAKPTSSKAGESTVKTTDGIKTIKQLFSTRSFDITVDGSSTRGDEIPDSGQEIAVVAAGNPTGDDDGALLNHCRRRVLGYI
jgi:hypothetical protein